MTKVATSKEIVKSDRERIFSINFGPGQGQYPE